MEREHVREFQSTHGCFVCIAHSLYHGIKNDTAQSVFSLWNGQEFFISCFIHSQLQWFHRVSTYAQHKGKNNKIFMAGGRYVTNSISTTQQNVKNGITLPWKRKTAERRCFVSVATRWKFLERCSRFIQDIYCPLQVCMEIAVVASIGTLWFWRKQNRCYFGEGSCFQL